MANVFDLYKNNMYPNLIAREHLTHSRNPYIHKCCGCIHLRMGGTITCLIWAGLSLYFAILSFQAKSPFYSYMENTALYIFGTINLILFGVSLGTLFPLFLKLVYGIRTASAIINTVVFVLLVDMVVNTIVFIVRRNGYVQWCINSTAANLDSTLFNDQQVPLMINGTQQNFNPTMADFYNCNRTWEDEVKFSVLSTIVMIFVYGYWALSIFSYSIKLRIKMKHLLRNGMMARMDMMGNIMQQQGPGAEIMI